MTTSRQTRHCQAAGIRPGRPATGIRPGRPAAAIRPGRPAAAIRPGRRPAAAGPRGSFRAERSGRPSDRPVAAGREGRRPAIDHLSNLGNNMDIQTHHEKPVASVAGVAGVHWRGPMNDLVGSTVCFGDVSETGNRVSLIRVGHRQGQRLASAVRQGSRAGSFQRHAVAFFGGTAGTISRSSSSREIRGRRPGSRLGVAAQRASRAARAVRRAHQSRKACDPDLLREQPGSIAQPCHR